MRALPEVHSWLEGLEQGVRPRVGDLDKEEPTELLTFVQLDPTCSDLRRTPTEELPRFDLLVTMAVRNYLDWELMWEGPSPL